MNKLSDEYIKNIKRICQEAYTEGYNKALEETNIKELIEALREISEPVKYMSLRAKEEGSKLDGQIAIQLSESASYLKSIAKQALKNFEK